MPDLYFDVDAALSEVPVNFLPLLDDTDFKTIETAVAYDAAGMSLKWNFVTTAGAFTQTAVTPTSAGNYDWAHQGGGMYSIEIPASGGASINNDTEGFGWFTGVCTGILPWRGPVIAFRAAALNNALIDGGDLLDVNVTHVADIAQTGRDIGASVLLSSGTGTGQIDLSSGKVLLQTSQPGVTIPTVTTLTNAPSAQDITRTGTAQAGAAQTITLDASASAVDNFYCGQTLVITGGVGAGQSRSIAAYIGSTKVATLTNSWVTNPDNTSTFAIYADGCPVGVLSRGFASAGAAGTISLQTGETWATSFLIGSTIRIIAGTGKGQVRSVTANTNATPSVVSIDRNWTTNPDTTSVYEIYVSSDAMINTNDIGSSAIGATQIASNAIAAAKIATGAITNAKFAAGAIDAAAIADNAIDAGAIATGAITNAKFAAGAIDAAAIATNAIDADALATDAVTEIQTGLATPTNITTVATVTNLTNERGKYANGAVWIGPTVNTNTVNYVDGIITNPVSTIAAAKTIADSLGLRRFFTVRTGTTQLGADMVGYDFDGSSWSLTTTGGSRDVSSSSFHKAYVIGGTFASATASSWWDECEFSTGVTVAAANMQRCTFAGTLTLSAAGQYDFIDCSSIAAGTGTPVFAVPAGTVNISFRRWSGGIRITGITSGTTISIDMVSGGTVTLEGADGNVQVRGLVAEITDSRTGTPTLGQNAAVNITKINAEVDTALTDYDPPTKAELDAAVAPLATAASVADIPTVAEFEARTIPSADYVVTSDTLAAVTTVVNLTNAPTNGDFTATMKASINTEADTALTDYGALKPTVAGRTLDVTATGEAGLDFDNTAGTLAKGTDITGFNDLSAAQVNTEVDTALSDVGLTSTVTGRIDAAISTRLATAGYTAPDNASIASILTDTGTDIPALIDAVPTANENADALLDRAAGIETGHTLRQSLRLMLAALVGKLSGAATTTVTIRDVNDTKNRITATVDADGNRTAVTEDVS